LLVKARLPRGAHVRSSRATLAGRRIPMVRRKHGLYAVVDLRYVSRGTKRLAIRLRLASGRTATTRRTYRLCSKPRHRPKPRRGAKR
jgi:hypothetical protein